MDEATRIELFNQIYDSKKCQTVINRRAWKLDRQEGKDDAKQGMLEQIWIQLPSYDGEYALTTFVRVVCDSYILNKIDYHKAQRRNKDNEDRTTPDSVERMEIHGSCYNMNPADLVEIHDLCIKADVDLRELPTRIKRVLYDFISEQHRAPSLQELADLLGYASVSALKKEMKRN